MHRVISYTILYCPSVLGQLHALCHTPPSSYTVPQCWVSCMHCAIHHHPPILSLSVGSVACTVSYTTILLYCPSVLGQLHALCHTPPSSNTVPQYWVSCMHCIIGPYITILHYTEHCVGLLKAINCDAGAYVASVKNMASVA